MEHNTHWKFVCISICLHPRRRGRACFWLHPGTSPGKSKSLSPLNTRVRPDPYTTCSCGLRSSKFAALYQNLLCSFDLAFYHLSYFHSVIASDGSSNSLHLRLIIPSLLSVRSGLSIRVSLYNWLLSISSNSTWSGQTYQPQKFWILLSRWDMQV